MKVLKFLAILRIIMTTGCANVSGAPSDISDNSVSVSTMSKAGTAPESVSETEADDASMENDAGYIIPVLTEEDIEYMGIPWGNVQT